MKKLSIFSWILKIGIALTGAGLFVGWIVAPDVWHKPLSYLATIVLPFLPDIVRKLKFHPSEELVLVYEIFIIVSMVLGTDFDWYKFMWVTEDFSYFDKVTHFISGIVTVLIANELLKRAKLPNKWFKFLFLISCSALVATVWECYEFGYDQLFDGRMQQLVFSGVEDTMWDIISALGGGLVASIVLSQKK